jgi:hypothetical protein
MTIHVIFHDLRKKTPVKDYHLAVDKNDMIILAEMNESNEDPITLRIYHCPTDSCPYATRKSGNTIANAGEPLTAVMAQELENAADDLDYYSLIDVPCEESVSVVLTMVTNELSAETPYPKLEALLTMKENGGTFDRVNIDGSLWVLPDPPVVRTTTAAQFAATTVEDLMKLIDMIDPAVKYSGFTPRHTRMVVKGRNANMTVIAKEIVICFYAYSHIGNNIGKLGERRVDLAISSKVMDACTQIGIVKMERTKDALTLPRVAIAFMPEYLLFRKFIASELQDQTESSINVFYKDIAFDGCPTIRGMPGYSEYHKEFSNFIYKGKIEVKMDDAGFLTSYNRYLKVTRAGYNSDTQIHDNMKHAIEASVMTKQAAIQRIVENITNYT